jgi:DNA-binding HxlR family transcriptional regulator
MYTRKTEEELDCGIRVAFKIFGGKWKLCIIDAIDRGIARPAEIHKSMSHVSRRVFEMQLAELLFWGVIEKSAGDGFPKKSEYRLTDFGRTILPLLSQIDQWGTTHSAFVQERQRIYMAQESLAENR